MLFLISELNYSTSSFRRLFQILLNSGGKYYRLGILLKTVLYSGLHFSARQLNSTKSQKTKNKCISRSTNGKDLNIYYSIKICTYVYLGRSKVICFSLLILYSASSAARSIGADKHLWLPYFFTVCSETAPARTPRYLQWSMPRPRRLYLLGTRYR